MIENYQQTKNERKLSQDNKATYEKLTDSIILGETESFAFLKN